MVSQRQLLRTVPNEEGLPWCQLGTRPHFMVCRTRSSLVGEEGAPVFWRVFWCSRMCAWWPESKTGLRKVVTRKNGHVYMSLLAWSSGLHVGLRANIIGRVVLQRRALIERWFHCLLPAMASWSVSARMAHSLYVSRTMDNIREK